MERIAYRFRISPMDTDVLLPQVSRALEKRTNLVSRRQYPQLWKVTDRLNAVERAPEQTLKRRRIRTKLLGILCLALGIFLFIPGLMEPRELLVPLLAGAAGIGAGIGALWRSRKKKKNPFEKAARRLLEGKDHIPEGQSFQVCFSPEEMTIVTEHQGEVRKGSVRYSDFEYVIETDDILLLTHDTRVTVLQKRDLTAGSIQDFCEFIAEHTNYVSVFG